MIPMRTGRDHRNKLLVNQNRTRAAFRDNRVMTTHDMHDSIWRVLGPRRPSIFCLCVNYCSTLKIPDLDERPFWAIFIQA